jgi:opacity protein-like surface antigen
MKKFFKVFILSAGLILCLNANSFAVDSKNHQSDESKHKVELSAFIGYGLWGSGSDLEDVSSGLRYGARAHYIFSLSPTFWLGIGGFFLQSNIEFGYNSKLSRDAFGVDITLNTTLSEMPNWHPYARVTYSLRDKLEGLSGNGFGIGGGIQFDISHNVRLFGEIMYDRLTYDFSVSYTGPFGSSSYTEEIEHKFNMVSINAGVVLLL